MDEMVLGQDCSGFYLDGCRDIAGFMRLWCQGSADGV